MFAGDLIWRRLYLPIRDQFEIFHFVNVEKNTTFTSYGNNNCPGHEVSTHLVIYSNKCLGPFHIQDTCARVMHIDSFETVNQTLYSPMELKLCTDLNDTECCSFFFFLLLKQMHHKYIYNV